jgi:hypothetical protein
MTTGLKLACVCFHYKGSNPSWVKSLNFNGDFTPEFLYPVEKNSKGRFPMKKIGLLMLVVCMVVLTTVLSLPVAAQDSEPLTLIVSGTFDYTPEILVWEDVSGTSYIETTEIEIWSGDISGTGSSQDRIVISPSGAWEGWIMTTFEKVMVGDKEGGLVTLSTWKRPAETAEWQGEWVILRGTGDLENAHGSGSAWGPGFNPEDPEASPDIFYSGEVIFLEPVSE